MAHLKATRSCGSGDLSEAGFVCYYGVEPCPDPSELERGWVCFTGLFGNWRPVVSGEAVQGPCGLSWETLVGAVEKKSPDVCLSCQIEHPKRGRSQKGDTPFVLPITVSPEPAVVLSIS